MFSLRAEQRADELSAAPHADFVASTRYIRSRRPDQPTTRSARAIGEILFDMVQDNKETARRYYAEVWAKGDPAPLEEFLTDDYIDHNPTPGMSGDKAGAAQMVTSVMADTADVEMDVGHVIGEGDFVAAHWRMEWTQQGDFMGMIPADGKRLSLEGHDFIRFVDGQIAEIWHVEDVMSVMGQLGMLPGPPHP
jgi:steroid delta-isomerase-like uncharacterized protein